MVTDGLGGEPVPSSSRVARHCITEEKKKTTPETSSHHHRQPHRGITHNNVSNAEGTASMNDDDEGLLECDVQSLSEELMTCSGSGKPSMGGFGVGGGDTPSSRRVTRNVRVSRVSSMSCNDTETFNNTNNISDDRRRETSAMTASPGPESELVGGYAQLMPMILLVIHRLR